MKKKIIISGVIIVVIAAIIILFMQNHTRKPDEDTLVFEGDNKQKIIVDIAIQEDDEILYIGSVLLKDSSPTLENVLKTINASDEGVEISINDSGIIEAVNDFENTDEKKWKTYIDNKEVNQENISEIEMKKNNGITLIY